MSKIPSYLTIVLLLATPLAADGQTTTETLESGSVWIWTDPATFEEAVAISVHEMVFEVAADGTRNRGSIKETRVYFESPRAHRAEIVMRYDPETAGLGVIFRDVISGWRATIEGGMVFEDEDVLPIPQTEWTDLHPLLQDPQPGDLGFLEVDLDHRITLLAEHALDDDASPEELLLDRLDAWLAGLSADELLEGWDLPESTLEMLEFLETPHAESFRKQIFLLTPLIAATLTAHGELESRRLELLGQPADEAAVGTRPPYGDRDWKVTEGRLDGELADRAGARTMIDQIRKELETSE